MQASIDDINKAYKARCLLFHPDRHSGEQEKKDAEAIFVVLRKAHESKFYRVGFYSFFFVEICKWYAVFDLQLVLALHKNGGHFFAAFVFLFAENLPIKEFTKFPNFSPFFPHKITSLQWLQFSNKSPHF